MCAVELLTWLDARDFYRAQYWLGRVKNKKKSFSPLRGADERFTVKKEQSFEIFRNLILFYFISYEPIIFFAITIREGGQNDFFGRDHLSPFQTWFLR